MHFDRAHFAHMTGDDDALQREVLELFRNQAAEWDAQLAQPGADLAALAHTIKGTARGIGLPVLAEACEGLESALRQGAPLDLALARTREALADALAAIADVSPL